MTSLLPPHPTSEDRIPKAGREITTTIDSKMEMEGHYHGLCNRIIKGQEG